MSCTCHVSPPCDYCVSCIECPKCSEFFSPKDDLNCECGYEPTAAEKEESTDA